MKYYKELLNGKVIAYGITDAKELSGNLVEIDKSEYDQIVAEIAAEDAKRKADADAKRKQEEEEAEEKRKEHQAQVDSYVAQVKAGTIKIADVPEEYRAEVNNIINPPPTVEELKSQLDSAQSAIDYLILNGTGA